jgi:hypothetical protein
MEYAGLTGDNLANVRALNVAWLKLHSRAQRPAEQLSPRRIERLAAVPFLLFSFSEQDEDLWRRLLNEERQPDLLEAPVQVSEDIHVLQTSGLAFLWNLARHNPYVARVVSGVPSNWCEQIASVVLMRLLECTSRCALIQPRFEDEAVIHRRLLRHGGSALRDARNSAQISALHSMLMVSRSARYGRLPAAACQTPSHTRQVADKV